jgi:PAS domain S-box-containing protein
MPPVNASRLRNDAPDIAAGVRQRESSGAAADPAQRLALAMSAAQLGDWAWDAQTDVLTGSTRAAEIVGLPADGGVTRAALRALVPPEEAAQARERIAAAVEQRREFDVEFSIQRADHVVWVAVRGRGLYGTDGGIIGMAGVVQDITARRLADATLRAQEAQLRLISTNAPVILSHWSATNRLLFASRAFADRWQKSPEQLVGRAIPEILGAEAWAAVKPHVERVLAGEAVTFEQEIPYDGIGPRFMRVSYTPDLAPDGRVLGYLCAANDISDRRRAELALHASEERLRLATTTGKVGLWDWDIVANRITWTESLYEIHGVTPAEFTGTIESFTRLVHPDDRSIVARAIERSLQAATAYEVEFRAVRSNGDVCWLFSNAIVLRERGAPTGKSVRMSGATLDVTERKRAELALRESEGKFRTLASHAPVGIFMTNSDGDCLFVNESWVAMSGMPASEAAGSGWTRALHPDDRGRVTAEWYASANARRPFALEYRFLRPDGRVTWVQGSAVASRDATGAVSGYFGTVADITDRKTAEFALRESEKRFRTVANRAPVGIFMTDPRGETMFVNESWCAMAGLTAVQAQGHGWMNAVHPDDRARLAAGWDLAVNGGAASNAEFRFLRPNGSIAWVQGSAVQLRDPGGRLAGYVGTVADITARKLAEDEVRQQAQHLSLAVEAAQLGDWSWDPASDAISFSARGAEIFGVPVAAPRTRSQLRDLLHPDDRLRASEANARAIASKGDYDIEYRVRRPSGEWVWVAAKGRGIYDADGKLARMMGVVQDITARKLAEEKLRGQEAQLRLITTNAPIILSHCSHDLRLLFVNRAYAERFDLRPEDIIGRTVPEVIGSEAFAAIEPYVRRVLAGESLDFEVDVPYQKLGRRYMRVSYVPDVDAAGQVRGWLSAISDLTDRRRMEEALRASEAELREAQVQLHAHASELEKKVEMRTASLREAIGQMEEFSYSVSHDLRSPLRAMNGYAQALLEDYAPQLDETARGYLERIQRSSVRMEKLTYDVLNYSRIARGELQLAPVALDRLLSELIEQYAELQPAAADVHVRPPLHPVLAHEPSLGQCLGNLLTNAAKFVRAGERPRIRIGTETRDARVRIWVEDDGIGIPPQYHAALFQVFERLPTQVHYEGTGIGLAIVRKAAEKMGGSCGVESDGVHGSRFWVELAKA